MSRRMNIGGALAGTILFATACGGSGATSTPPPPPPPSAAMAKASQSGDNQSGPIGTVLPNPLRVILTQGATPVAGRTVTWQSQAGAQLSPGSGVTDADGIAITAITLPQVGGTSTVTATATGATGSPQAFSITATGAGMQVTVQVVNSEFQPATFNLQAGGTVTFTWGSGATGHSVAPVAPNTIPASSNPAPPGLHSAPYSFDTVFPSPGTFKFFCNAHGAPDSGMHGTITVVP